MGTMRSIKDPARRLKVVTGTAGAVEVNPTATDTEPRAIAILPTQSAVSYWTRLAWEESLRRRALQEESPRRPTSPTRR